MSKKLEKKVEELIKLHQDKKEIGQKRYRVERDYDRVEETIKSLLESGHTLPEESPFFAETVEEQKGKASYKDVVDRFRDKYIQYKGVIDRFVQESRETLVQRLHYGRKSEQDTSGD